MSIRESARLSRNGFAVLLLVAGIGLSVGTAARVASSMGRPHNFDVVLPGSIYRSGQIDADDIEAYLIEHGIGVIVNLGEDKSKPDHRAEIEAARRLNIERHTFYLLGNGTGSIESYARAIEVMDRAVRAGRPILVHCSVGAQRTSGAIGFYRLLVRRDAPDGVMAELKRFHNPDDNPQLIAYMNRHMGELASMLVDRGVIERVPVPLPVAHP